MHGVSPAILIMWAYCENYRNTTNKCNRCFFYILNIAIGFVWFFSCLKRLTVVVFNYEKLFIHPGKVLAGGGSWLEDNKDSLIDDLHDLDSLINDLYKKDSRIRDQHKILAGGRSCLEDNKDSLIDDLHNKDLEPITKGVLLVLITDTRILMVEITNKGINIQWEDITKPKARVRI